eukprot:14457977-Heterocapsa_arctica.AAC.1
MGLDFTDEQLLGVMALESTARDAEQLEGEVKEVPLAHGPVLVKTGCLVASRPRAETPADDLAAGRFGL